MQTGILGYFALNDAQDSLAARAARAAGMLAFRLPSYGGFSTTLKTTYRWGLTVDKVSYPGVMMDVDLVHQMAWAKDNDATRFAPFNRTQGSRLSAMEHLVPEQLFSTPGQAADGISAVKALSIAAAEGQKIYTFMADKAAEILPKLNIDSEAMTEIQRALNEGKEVTVSEWNISHAGWTGVGYLLIDPASGAGAYKISGGADGGELVGGLSAAALMLGIVGVGVALEFGVLLYLLLAILTASITVLIMVMEMDGEIDICRGFAVAGVVGGFLAPLGRGASIFDKVLSYIVSNTIGVLGLRC